MAEIEAQQHTVTNAQTTYHQALHRITKAIHPFSIQTLEWQLFDELSTQLKEPLAQMAALAETYGSQKATKAINTFEQQIPSMAQRIHAWWRWVSEALPAYATDGHTI